MPRTFTMYRRSGTPHPKADFRAGLSAIAALCLSVIVFGGCYNDPESRLAEIRAMQAGGRFEEAIQPLRVLLTASPDNPEANYRLGISLAQTGRASLALWPLMKAAKTDQFGVQAGLLLASTLISQQSYTEGIRASTAVLKRDPDNILALNTRAHASIGASLPGEALKDAEHILRLRPDDSNGHTIKMAALIDLKRWDEAEQSHLKLKTITEAGTNIDKAARACGVLARFYLDRERSDEAEVIFEECLEKYPAHPMVQAWATSFYQQTGRPELAVGIWEKAVEANPEALELRMSLAEVLRANERQDDAEKVLVEAADLFDTAAAWQRLSNLYRSNGKVTEARAALQKSIERARVEPEVLRYRLADLFIEEGDLESAQEIANSMKEASYRHMLNGAILLAQNRPKEALDRFEAGFRLWPNNARARFLSGRAAQKLGNSERAISEFREAVRIDDAETDASLELARIFLSLGQYTTAQQFINRYHKSHPIMDKPDAYIIGARAAVGLGDPGAGIEVLKRLGSDVRFAAAARVEQSAILRETEGPEAAVKWLESSDIDLYAPSNDLLLRLFLEDLVTLGRSKEALSISKKRLEQEPDNASVLELRGRVLARLERTDEAKKLMAEALERDPDQAGALEVLGMFAAQEGKYEIALEYLDRSIAADPNNAENAYTAANIATLLGNHEDSVARLRKVVIRFPGHVAANNDLAWRLAEMNTELEFALALATRAVLNDRNAHTLDTLGWVQYKRESFDDAASTFSRALELQPDSASIRYRLALALAKKGNSSEAQAELETAIGAGSFPERKAAEAELARLQGS